ncbi:nucleoside-triphosphatase [Hyperthermus butylicus]|uniref:Nucleoside-triphosphatase THEP1 n=1 Tax=Hyperthermus butylicus (strain DSM 5456 / JCM 9403 / PLM1-5) TaxID=415426 RepID=NTPTH_HYPBU|nr:nucleoside-triphosphatase [Hyperthermus butylicus]A2BL86.1 RecName: Full=Nucleoside-triphosphatase THEP1; Short=NTPase THEP1; AltName: Full=Nucleoside triphosphate phosphohydrolase [Hyperthermus butylicus DSM 5456]ABM80747.1 universally conserved protein [Hyperthermus butylicus DSM 5456]
MHSYVVVTGRPGVGKTTLFWKVVRKLMDEGVVVKGFYCPEVRGQQGYRIGFKIVLLDGSGEAWLARREGCNGPRVGRYYTCPEAETIASRVLGELGKADLIAIDEIGPMELRLAGVRRTIYRVLDSGKPGLFVVHERLSDPYILARLKPSGVWFHVTIENRDVLPEKVYEAVKQAVARSKGVGELSL